MMERLQKAGAERWRVSKDRARYILLGSSCPATAAAVTPSRKIKQPCRYLPRRALLLRLFQEEVMPLCPRDESYRRCAYCGAQLTLSAAGIDRRRISANLDQLFAHREAATLDPNR